MKREIGLTGLMFASISAIIGSGWLFSAYYTSSLAGPAAFFSWLIGGITMICVALVFVEPCAMLPVSGSSARIPQCTHGTTVSFFFAWVIWLAYVTYVSAEAQAVIQYARFYFPYLTEQTGRLTIYGYLAISCLVLFFSIINIYSIRWLIRVNTFLTIFKLLIPFIIAISLIVLFFSHHYTIHFHKREFMPFGYKGILYAISSGGIIFAFNGFKQAAEMAGEAKNPGRNLPIAIIGSIVVCLILYLVLQLAFLSALQPINLIHGWGNLNLSSNTSPFATVLHEHGCTILLPLLYVAAIVAPMAAGLMYFSAAARSIYGMSCNGYLPSFFQKLNPFGNAVYAVIANFIVSMLLFAPLPGWDKLATFLSSLLALSYVIGPLSLLALRKQLPDKFRPFRLRFAKPLSFVTFYVCTLLLYWSGWNIISKLSIAIVSGFLVLFLYRLISRRGRKMLLHGKCAIWLLIYFIGITFFSYIGNFGRGLGLVPFGWDFFILAVFSLLIMMLSMKYILSPQFTKKYIEEQLKIKDSAKIVDKIRIFGGVLIL